MFFQTKNNVPNVYTNESRDFNIFEQIYDLAFNSCLSYTNKINYIKSVSKIDASLLPKLATYLGFITSVHYPEKILRSILINYPDIIRNKGTKKAIRLAVLSLQNAFTGITYLDVFINNDKAESNYRVVEIVTDGVVIDRLYIEDLLKHILPIGYVFGWIKVASPYNIYSAYRQQDLVVSVRFVIDTVPLISGLYPSITGGGTLGIEGFTKEYSTLYLSLSMTLDITGVEETVTWENMTITQEEQSYYGVKFIFNPAQNRIETDFDLSTMPTTIVSYDIRCSESALNGGYKVRQTPTDIIQDPEESDLSINTKNYLYNLIGHTKISQSAVAETSKNFKELYTNFQSNNNSTETEGE